MIKKKISRPSQDATIEQILEWKTNSIEKIIVVIGMTKDEFDRNSRDGLNSLIKKRFKKARVEFKNNIKEKWGIRK